MTGSLGSSSVGQPADWSDSVARFDWALDRETVVAFVERPFDVVAGSCLDSSFDFPFARISYSKRPF